jgi:hypothetical protein
MATDLFSNFAANQFFDSQERALHQWATSHRSMRVGGNEVDAVILQHPFGKRLTSRPKIAHQTAGRYLHQATCFN